MRFRIRASWGACWSAESIVDGPAERYAQLRAFQAIPGLIELFDEPYEGAERSGTWLNVPILSGSDR